MNENERELLRRLLVDLFLASPRKTTTARPYDDCRRPPDNASIDVKRQSSNGLEKESQDVRPEESKKRVHNRRAV